jgi:hypothetical protein
MDPIIEVVFTEGADTVLRDRFELPLFFIVGGADDAYLSKIIGQPIRALVLSKTVDINSEESMGVYASRYLLPSRGRARSFPLSTFLNDEWPILSNIESTEKDTKIPTNVEITWIIRALRRAGQLDLANKIRNKMIHRIYPEKIKAEKVPTDFNINTLAQLYLDLSDSQRDYPLVMLVDDLPIQLPISLGQILVQISITGCTNLTNMKALETSIRLLHL